MGLFNNLFSTKAAHPHANYHEKSAEMMDEVKFWHFIDESLKHSSDQESQEEFITSKLEKLQPKEIIGFRLRTDFLLYQSYTPELWCAAHIMNGGCSDDGFEYFRCWLISRGKNTFYKAKENPDTLVDEIKAEQQSYEFESFWYVALEAFHTLTGKDLYSFIDEDKFKAHEGNYPALDFNWKDEDPESMQKICPKLFASFN